MGNGLSSPEKGCSNSVFDFDPLQLVPDRLCADPQKQQIGKYVKRGVRKCCQHGGKVGMRLNAARCPKHAPYVHDCGVGNACEKSVYKQPNASLLQRLGKKPREKTDQAPGQHLKGCPGALPEDEIGQKRGQRSRIKACLWAKIDGAKHNECRDRLEKGMILPTMHRAMMTDTSTVRRVPIFFCSKPATSSKSDRMATASETNKCARASSNTAPMITTQGMSRAGMRRERICRRRGFLTYIIPDLRGKAQRRPLL